MIQLRKKGYLMMNTVKRLQKGFTLIEIMIVVAIIGILASIAVPSYKDYVKKGKAAEATATLADLRIRMEQCFQDNRSYATCAAFCAPTSGAINFSYACVATGPLPDPLTSITPATLTYRIAAKGLSSKGMSGFEFSVDQNNAKTSKYDGSAEKSCWLTSKTGSC